MMHVVKVAVDQLRGYSVTICQKLSPYPFVVRAGTSFHLSYGEHSLRTGTGIVNSSFLYTDDAGMSDVAVICV